MSFDITGTGNQSIAYVEFKLEQNYPNPFNPSTEIRFSVPQSDKTSLIVYDVLGKEIAVVVNRELNTGDYEFGFDG